jgi:hypothetical protein
MFGWKHIPPSTSALSSIFSEESSPDVQAQMTRPREKNHHTHRPMESKKKWGRCIMSLLPNTTRDVGKERLSLHFGNSADEAIPSISSIRSLLPSRGIKRYKRNDEKGKREKKEKERIRKGKNKERKGRERK